MLKPASNNREVTGVKNATLWDWESCRKTESHNSKPFGFICSRCQPRLYHYVGHSSIKAKPNHWATWESHLKRWSLINILRAVRLVMWLRLCGFSLNAVGSPAASVWPPARPPAGVTNVDPSGWTSAGLISWPGNQESLHQWLIKGRNGCKGRFPESADSWWPPRPHTHTHILT